MYDYRKGTKSTRILIHLLRGAQSRRFRLRNTRKWTEGSRVYIRYKKWLSLNFPENYPRNRSIIALSIYIRYKTARLL